MLSDGKKQGTVFQMTLGFMLDKSHPLYILANEIEWNKFQESFKELYCHANGRPAKPIRLMVGLHYLKYTYDLSDEAVVSHWVENPYWQYFCGEDYFQHKLPIDPSSMTRWRKRVEDKGLDQLLRATIETGLKIGAIRKTDLKNVNVDTTVSEKNITFPTDAKLLYNNILKLGEYAKKCGIKLRQSFVRVGKGCMIRQNRYRRANRHKKANKEIKKLKTYLPKLIRDIERKASDEFLKDPEYIKLRSYAERLLTQTRYSKNKLYSLHEPHVECISKGKAHKKYEFGCKVGIVATSKKCFVLSGLAFHGAPYDGHTLAQNIEHAKKMIDGLGKINRICVDQGYRKHNYQNKDSVVNIVKRGWRKVDRTLRRWLRRRTSIEPVIGHMKTDGRLDRNYLKGKDGDKANAILCACGFNMRKLLAHIFCTYFKFYKKLLFIAKFLKKSKINLRTELSFARF